MVDVITLASPTQHSAFSHIPTRFSFDRSLLWYRKCLGFTWKHKFLRYLFYREISTHLFVAGSHSYQVVAQGNLRLLGSLPQVAGWCLDVVVGLLLAEHSIAVVGSHKSVVLLERVYRTQFSFI